MKANFHFRCFGCGTQEDHATAPYLCHRCGEPLSIESAATIPSAALRSPPRSLWHYRELLPVTEPDRMVSLGEGATPLLEAPRLAGQLGFSRLYIKNEATNPTGSFKDRQIAVGMARALEVGAHTVAVVSSGNVACAASAYAARAGLRAILLMHGHAASAKATQAAAYGARCFRVRSPAASAVFDLCIRACRELGWYHLSTAGMYEPFNVEGAKTIAYEIYQQTDGNLPDWVVAPVGGGGLLGGIWRGFLDLKRMGLIETLPRLAGIQAAGCAPLVDAIQNNRSFLETLQTPWQNPKTIAGGIADDILFDGHTVLPAIRTTGGAAFAVSDEEIREAQTVLARNEGLLCEPSSAAAFAALRKLSDIARGLCVCVVLTGSGIKDLDGLRDQVPPAIAIDATLEALTTALER